MARTRERKAAGRTGPLIFSGSGGLSLAAAVAGQLGLQLGKRDLERFPDGECHARILESVRGGDVYFVVSTGPPVEANLVELLLLADACRRAGAARRTAVIPYFGYARQDRRSAAGNRSGRASSLICSRPAASTASLPSICTVRRSKASSPCRSST